MEMKKKKLNGYFNINQYKSQEKILHLERASKICKKNV